MKLLIAGIAAIISPNVMAQPSSVINKVITDKVAEGGRAFPGQFGQTVVQFQDHYSVCAGLICVSNPGQYHPLPTSTRMPTEPGTVGQIMWEESTGRMRWIYGQNGWIDADTWTDAGTIIKPKSVWQRLRDYITIW
jgi:hypothetical protein